jgi:hypothetical protein
MDDAAESYAQRKPGSPDFRLSVLDRKRRSRAARGTRWPRIASRRGA